MDARRQMDAARPAAPRPRFPPQPDWFRDSRGFDALDAGLRAAGFSAEEVGHDPGGELAPFPARRVRPPHGLPASAEPFRTNAG